MTAISSALPSWMRLLWVDVPADADLGEKKRIRITNGAALFVGLLGPLFLVMNLMQGQTGLAIVNACSSLVGLLTLFVLRCRYTLAAAVLVVTGSACLFTLSAFLYRNGMEYSMLVCMFGAVFMFDQAPLRVLMAGINAAGFVWVKVHEFKTYLQSDFPLGRYATNLVVFLICYYVLQELLRSAYRNYHKEIERKNTELAESRRQLQEEHARLAARTAELQVANQAKEKLFSIIAHDLRGPLAGLSSTMAMLNSGHLGAKDFRELLADLTINVGHAHECLDTLLTWSASQLRGITPVPAALPLDRVTEGCVALLATSAARKAVTIHNRVPPEAGVWADENQLLAILRNLLANALKFTPSGGSIEVDAVLDGAFWRITVADTGIGMAPETVRALFATRMMNSTPGTENERGLGLGLTICREFVESNGGTLFAESTVGRGSRFSFTLPVG